MNLSEIAQKNARIRFWREAANKGALDPEQSKKMIDDIKVYQTLLFDFADKGTISEQNIADLCNLERKLEQFAESSRLEAGKSSLL